MLSKTASDVLSEGEYDRVRMQLHQALHGNGNSSRGVHVWLAGRRISISMLRDTGRSQSDARRIHHA